MGGGKTKIRGIRIMYLALNTALRKAVNSSPILLDGVSIPAYWAMDDYTENGPHIVISRETSDPIANDLGHNPAQEVTGFLQLMIKVPRTGEAIDAILSSLESQVWQKFPISTHKDGGLKLAYNSVKAGPHLTVGGFASSTMRINFNAFYCI